MMEISSLNRFINMTSNILLDSTDDRGYTFTILGGEAEVVNYSETFA